MSKPTIQQIEADLMDDGRSRAISINADGSVTTIECHGLDNAHQVFFYEQDFYVLSNFSAFSLKWRGRRFDTSEAAYHWERFATGQSSPDRGPAHGSMAAEIADMIQFADSAHQAFKIAQENKYLQRPDWDDVKVDHMRTILRAKANQHEYVRRKLLATGERELIENSWRDAFWGWGSDGNGQNMLGKLWMEVRRELRPAPRSLDEILSEHDPAHVTPGKDD